MKTLPVAVQVYSVREDAEKDFAGTMKKIKEIGYDGVELAGLYGLEPAAIKAAIEDAGLVALSAHVPGGKGPLVLRDPCLITLRNEVHHGT